MRCHSLVCYILLICVSSLAAADLPDGTPDLLKFAVVENERALQEVGSVSYHADAIYNNASHGTTVTTQDVIESRPSRFVSAIRSIRSAAGDERVLKSRAVNNDQYRAIWETDGRNARSFEHGVDGEADSAKTSMVLSAGPDYLLEGPFGFGQKTLRELVIASANDGSHWECKDSSKDGTIVAMLVSNDKNQSSIAQKEFTLDPKSGFLITRIIEYAAGREVRRTEVKARPLEDGKRWFPIEMTMKEGSSSAAAGPAGAVADLQVSFSNVTLSPHVDENSFTYPALQMPEGTLVLAWSPARMPHDPQVWSSGRLIEFKRELPSGRPQPTKAVSPDSQPMRTLLLLVLTLVGVGLLLFGCWSVLQRAKTKQMGRQ